MFIYIGKTARSDIGEDNVPFAREFVNLFNFFSPQPPPTHVHRTQTHTRARARGYKPPYTHTQTRHSYVILIFYYPYFILTITYLLCYYCISLPGSL